MSSALSSAPAPRESFPGTGGEMAAVRLNARLLNRAWAAAYVSVSPTQFDKMVKDGTMPRPRRISAGRLGWLRHELDAAAEALPHDGQPAEVNPWDED